MKLQELTKAEEQVMHVVWQLDRCALGQIVEAYPGKAAYTTLQTIVKVLVEKGFVGSESVGKTNQYFPLISKDDYSAWLVSTVADRFFDGSAASMLRSAFSAGKGITAEEYDELSALAEQLLTHKPI